MAQEQLFTYRQNDFTFDLTRENVGVLEKGLYKGFDFIPTSDLNLTLDQSVTGIQYLEANGTSLKNQSGIFKTSQGTIVIDDGTHILPITQSPVSNPRIDAVVAEHVYKQSSGGQVAIIKLVRGDEAVSPVLPSINENTEVLLGYVTLPVGVTSLDAEGVTYFRNDVTIWHKQNFNPDDKADQSEVDALEQDKADQSEVDALALLIADKAPANANYAYTDAVNEFTKQQQFNKGASIAVSNNAVVTSDGNYFQVTGSGAIESLSALRTGTRITLRALDVSGFVLRHNESIGDPAFKKVISSTNRDVYLIQNDVVELIEDNDGWIITKQPASNYSSVNDVVMWSGSPTSLPPNWALCNGQTIEGFLTPNLSGRFVVGYDQGMADYNTVGNQGGVNSVTLTEAQLPSHTHSSGTLGADALGSEHQHDTPVPLGDTGNLNNSENDAWQSNLNAQDQTVNNTTSQHTHTISGDTGSVGNGESIDARPPYYTLAYIVKYR